MATAPFPRLTPEEYLRIERSAPARSEFWDGRMFLMAGAQPDHELIASNAIAELRAASRGRCKVFGSNLRIHIHATGHYTYADVTVCCEKPRYLDGELDTLLNPKLIVEVLPPSTEAYDRGRKFESYKTIPGFAHYVLISQAKPLVEWFVRESDGRWTAHSASGLDAEVTLPALDCTIPLREIYLGVFPSEGE